MSKKKVFSGIQPSGELHIGNYLGAMRRWVDAQDEWDSIYCIVDLHAITVNRPAEELRNNIRNLAAWFLAIGLDSKKVAMFVQSDVSEHAELSWILNCLVPMGAMSRMTQFKEKSGKKRDTASVGLFAYPALMAADILLYQTDIVPVGDDQKQHVELTRDVAESFNKKYGDVFKVPEPVIAKSGARIMGLDDPTCKMAKSDKFPNRAIYLLDEPDVIKKKIARATTDSLTDIVFDSERHGVFNLLTIYQLFSGKSQEEIEANFKEKQYSDLKRELTELVVDSLEPLKEKFIKIRDDQAYLDGVLEEGANRVRPIAQKTLQSVKEKIGLGK